MPTCSSRTCRTTPTSIRRPTRSIGSRCSTALAPRSPSGETAERAGPTPGPLCFRLAAAHYPRTMTGTLAKVARARRLWLFHVALVIGLLVAAPAARADEPVRGNLVLGVAQVEPGGSVPVSGYLFDPGLEISLTLRQGPRSVPVGTVTVRPDGTIGTSVTVPADFEDGFAELVGTGQTSGEWRASVLVGDPSTAEPAAGVRLDGRTLALIAFGAGLVIFVVAGLVGRRSRRIASPSPD